MRVRFASIFIVLCAITAGCEPEKKCGGKLYYDPMTTNCRPCPKDSTFKNGSCQCQDQYEFADNKCMLMDGAVVAVPDAGSTEAGASAGVAVSCSNYCDFAKVCIADNGLAAAALADIVTGLKAMDSAACRASCKTDTGGDGSSDPVVACIEAGRAKAACAGDSTQAGLTGALTLIGDCCKASAGNALCKSICKVLTANTLVKDAVSSYCK